VDQLMRFCGAARACRFAAGPRARPGSSNRVRGPSYSHRLMDVDFPQSLWSRLRQTGSQPRGGGRWCGDGVTTADVGDAVRRVTGLGGGRGRTAEVAGGSAQADSPRGGHPPWAGLGCSTGRPQSSAVRSGGPPSEGGPIRVPGPRKGRNSGATGGSCHVIRGSRLRVSSRPRLKNAERRCSRTSRGQGGARP